MDSKQIIKMIRDIENDLRRLTPMRISVKEFCEITGVNQAWLYKWRKGHNASLDQVLKMAGKLGF